MWNLMKLIETYYMKFHETSEIISPFEKTWNFLSLSAALQNPGPNIGPRRARPSQPLPADVIAAQGSLAQLSVAEVCRVQSSRTQLALALLNRPESSGA